MALFVATIWLNQSVIRVEWEAEKAEVFAAPSRHVARLMRYPFVFLYRRAGDEELYFFTASQILGKPAPGIEIPDRGEVPPSFRKQVITPDGRWHAPYAEVPTEYPPLLIPFIVMPRMVADSATAYCRVFGALMGTILLVSAWIVLRTVRQQDRSSRYAYLAVLLLAHGALAIQRLDAVVALLLAVVFVSLVERRPALTGMSLGLACAAKLVPVLLIPAVVACDLDLWRASRNRLVGLAAFAASAALGLLPMFVWSPTALTELLTYHGARGLQVESTLGVLYGALHAMMGHPVPTRLDYGSYNFMGEIPSLLGRACMPLSLLALAGYAWFLVRRRNARLDPSFVANVMVGALVVLWLSAKVFSPQYLTWALPIVLAFSGKREKWLFFAVLLLSQIYLRGYYDYVFEQRPLGVVSMVARQGLLVALVWSCVARWREQTLPLYPQRRES